MKSEIALGSASGKIKAERNYNLIKKISKVNVVLAALALGRNTIFTAILTAAETILINQT